MKSLPPEMVCLVIAQCQHQDLQNLRLVCKLYDELIAPILFRTHYMGFFYSHLERLMALSKSRNISRCVKNLCFLPDLLPEYWNQDSYKDSASAIHPTNEDKLAASFAAYNDLRQSQMQLLELDHDVFEIFSTAIARLENLVEIDFRPFSTTEANFSPPWLGLRKTLLNGPADWIRGGLTNDDEYVAKQEDISEMQTKLIFTAMFQDKTRSLKTLRIRSAIRGHLLPRSLQSVSPASELCSSSSSSSPLPSLTTAFGHLECLDLNVRHLLPTASFTSSSFVPDIPARVQGLVSDLTTLFTTAESLHTLHLHLDPGNLSHSMRPLGQDILTQLIQNDDVLNFPHLRALTMNVKSTEDSIRKFLHLNAKTLMTVDLGKSCIFDGCGRWAEVIYNIKPPVFKISPEEVRWECLIEAGGSGKW